MSVQEILSPKIVQSNGGYAAKVDVQNVDIITCNTIKGPVSLTDNCGVAIISSGNTSVTITDSNITTKSIVIVTPTDVGSGNNGYYVTTSTGSFTVHIVYTYGSSIIFNYFIAKY
jgi:hypothetical protein